MKPDRTVIEILLVEDNPGDARLAELAFTECSVKTHLTVTLDGEDAMAALRRTGKYTDTPRPDIILLDLNLPRKDGREVLAELKADEDLKSIPVIVLTTSNSDDDINRSYQLHANCYIVKPVDLDMFFEVVRGIESFWLNMVRLPTREQ